MVVVEIEVQTLAHGVEAMHEVDSIDCCKVCVWPMAPAFRQENDLRGVLSQAAYVVRAQDVRANVCEAIPCGVYFGAGWLTVDGLVSCG